MEEQIKEGPEPFGTTSDEISTLENLRDQVNAWLKEGKVDIFLGYKMVQGHSLPHCFTKENPDEAHELIIGKVRYSLEKMVANIAAQRPDIKIGLLVRDCNQRALNVLYVWNQLNPDRVKPINITHCLSRLKEHEACSDPEPQPAGSYKKQVGIDNNMNLEAVEAFSQEERFHRWMYEFNKCIKCYGCRNICPVCFCRECSMEHNDLIATGSVPPEIPIFHLVRAVHMAGRCIDCGLCEDACPVDIPLRLLYRKANQVVLDVFDYNTGMCDDQSPFNILGDEVTLEPRPI
jgi:formate dehydrogenase (coenzyme F420) beta subunit